MNYHIEHMELVDDAAVVVERVLLLRVMLQSFPYDSNPIPRLGGPSTHIHKG
jgi:hypothetical protein